MALGPRIETVTLDSGSPRSMENGLPNHQKSEFSLFLSTKLFIFALDQFRINSGSDGEELRAAKVVRIKQGIGEGIL